MSSMTVNIKPFSIGTDETYTFKDLGQILVKSGENSRVRASVSDANHLVLTMKTHLPSFVCTDHSRSRFESRKILRESTNSFTRKPRFKIHDMKFGPRLCPLHFLTDAN